MGRKCHNDHFVDYSEQFLDVIGDDPQFCALIETDAHVPLSGFKRVAIKRLQLEGDEFPYRPLDLSVVRQPSSMANGMTLDREGRLVISEQGTRASQTG